MIQTEVLYDDMQPYNKKQGTRHMTGNLYVSESANLRNGEVGVNGEIIRRTHRRSRETPQYSQEDLRRLRERRDAIAQNVARQESLVAKERATRGRGVPVTIATLVLVLTFCGFSMAWLSMQSTLAETQKSITTTQGDIDACARANAALRATIADASSEGAICGTLTEDLEMVKAYNIPAIVLPAIDTRPATGELPVYDLEAIGWTKVANKAKND